MNFHFSQRSMNFYCVTINNGLIKHNLLQFLKQQIEFQNISVYSLSYRVFKMSTTGRGACGMRLGRWIAFRRLRKSLIALLIVVCGKSSQSCCSTLFIARQHTDARYWYSKSVPLSVRLLRSGIVWKRLNVLSYGFTSVKHFHEIPTGSPPKGALNTGGV